MADIVIAGGGLAAVRTAQALRDAGFAGSLRIVSDEPERPYDRPPLSKGFLTGAVSEDAIRLLSDDAIARLGVELRLETRAIDLDPGKQRLIVATGEAIAYGRLVIATGARPMRLPSLAGCPAVHVLRCLDDARALRAALADARRVAIVGGGLIGLEVASLASAMSASVTVIEAAQVPLAPVLGAPLGELLRGWHEAKGIVFRCGVSAIGIEGGAAGHQLRLSDGSMLPTDLVVLGIGTLPNTEWLAGSGLELYRGLVVDDLGRTRDQYVFGVGDVTCRVVDGIAHPSRQWTATTEQARRVARAMLGNLDQTPRIDDHYFWSDQHGTRLQFAGSTTPDARLQFVVGDARSEKFVVLAVADRRVRAVFSLGLPREFIRHGGALRRGEAMLV